ncbi:hypothetical protein Zmor_026565 [Zophobas morio]|uniref:Pre-C2HC domain-containing protein n=1 Tax=Zophobas morio TaxID=2755281 RepID=A0AA38M584_9CUCU|nr:hypothetical protein Zmor_026565 [Zophobas morio]
MAQAGAPNDAMLSRILAIVSRMEAALKKHARRISRIEKKMEEVYTPAETSTDDDTSDSDESMDITSEEAPLESPFEEVPTARAGAKRPATPTPQPVFTTGNMFSALSGEEQAPTPSTSAKKPKIASPPPTVKPKPPAKPAATEKPAPSAAGKKQQKNAKPQTAPHAAKQQKKPQPQPPAGPSRDTARAKPATTAETTPVVDETPAEPRPEPQEETMETEVPVVTPRPPTTPKSRIPPIILRDGQRWSEVSRRMTDNSIRYSKAKSTPEGVRIQPVEVSDFRSLVRLLDNMKVQYHTFTLPEEKTLRVVIRGIAVGVASQEVLEDLESLGLQPIQVSRMSRNDRPMPLVLAEMPMAKKAEVFEVKTLCGLSVKVEKPHKRKDAAQCHRCQRFHHSQRNCRAEHRCVKCGADHQTSDCEKQRRQPAKCANCSGPHPASYKGCPKFPKSQQQKASKKPPTSSKTTAPRTAAPKRGALPKATPKPKPAPVPKKVALTARQQADLQLQKTQLMTAIAAAKDSQSMAEKMAIAFWNANGLRSGRYELEEFMEDHQLDAILVNETNLLWDSRDPKMPGYTLHRTERRDGNGRGTAIYVEDIADLVAGEEATIAAGDFNAKHSDWHSRQNNANGRRLLTFLHNTAEVDVISTEEPTFYHRARPDAPGDVLDIALVKNLRHEVDVNVVDELHSDHLPVIMRIGNEPNDPAANIITTTDWTKFAEHIKGNFGEFVTNFQDSEQVERATLDYENRIRASIDATSIRRPVRPFKRPAIPQRIANLIREKNRARRTARRTGEQDDRTAANRLQWEVRRALLNLRNEQWEQRLESLNTVDGSTWKMAKALRSDKRPLPPIHSANNGIVFTEEDKAAAFAHSLENQCQTNIDPDADDEHLDLVEETVEEIRMAEPDEDDQIREVHPDEIREIIRLLKPRKAPGPDGIPNKALKNLSDEAIVALAGQRASRKSNPGLRKSYPGLHRRDLNSTPCAAIQTARDTTAYRESHQGKEQSQTNSTTNWRIGRPDCSEPPPMGSPASTAQS